MPRYHVVVRAAAEDGVVFELEETWIEADSREAARTLAIRNLWDARLDTVGCSPSVEVGRKHMTRTKKISVFEQQAARNNVKYTSFRAGRFFASFKDGTTLTAEGREAELLRIIPWGEDSESEKHYWERKVKKYE